MPGTTLTAEERKDVQLLDRFKCRDCGEFKSNDNFANKVLNNYRYQVAIGGKPNAISAKLRCRGCSGAQIQELQCEGPCGEWKSLVGFSKSQRKTGSAGWCWACIGWKEDQEPGTVTTAAPGIGGDDLNAGGDDNRSTTQGGNDGDGDDFITMPYQISTMSITDGDTQAMNTSNGVSERGPSGFLPPHLADTMSVSSISNPYDDDRTVMASHSNQRPITFTAYDSTGQAHIRQRVPPSTTQSTYQAGSASSSSPSITRAPLNTDNSKWAKPVGTRNANARSGPVQSAPVQSTPNCSTRPTRHQQQSSYESSDDEM